MKNIKLTAIFLLITTIGMGQKNNNLEAKLEALRNDSVAKKNLETRLEALRNDSVSKKLDITIFDKYNRLIDTSKQWRFENFQTKFERPRTPKDTFPVDIQKEYFVQRSITSGFRWIEQYDSNNNLVREIEIGGRPGQTGARIEIKEKIDELFWYEEHYFSNGNIWVKRIRAPLFGFSIGIQYVFDENGILIKKEDTDDGYTFTYEDVFLFCKEKGVPLVDEYEQRYVQIEKRITPLENIKIWKIDCKSEIDTESFYNFYLLDAANGNVIRTGKMNMPLK